MKNDSGLKLLALAVIILASVAIGNMLLNAQPPASITQAYGLTLERDDFGPVSFVPPGTNTFTTSISWRSNFLMVFRNGLLQRVCAAGQTVGCDFTVVSPTTIAYPPGVIQPSDLMSLLFYR
jgi:hypothetical protein